MTETSGFKSDGPNDKSRMTPEAMQATLDLAVDATECSAPVLLMQDAADPTWWDVSLDQGLTWHFFATSNTPAASLVDRFTTVLSGQWDHATADDWIAEEQSEPGLDEAEREVYEETRRLRYLQELEREASIAPAITGFRRNEYLANYIRVRRLLELLDDLQARLAGDQLPDKQFLQTVRDASGDLACPSVLSEHAVAALRATESAMCPFYAGFLWAGCDGLAVITQRLDLCVRRARAVLVAWLVSGSAQIFADKSPDRHVDGDLGDHVAVLELVLQRVSGWVTQDDALHEWGQAAMHLRRQIRKLDRLSAAPAHKDHARLAHTACKFLTCSEGGFRAVHESAYSVCSAQVPTRDSTVTPPWNNGRHE